MSAYEDYIPLYTGERTAAKPKVRGVSPLIQEKQVDVVHALLPHKILKW
jgi:hypothetical protein